MAPTDHAKPEFYTGLEGLSGDGRDFDQRLQVKFIPDPRAHEPGAVIIGNLIRRGDILRSVRLNPDGPTRGDARILAKLRKVPASYYAPYPGYFSNTVLQAAGGAGRLRGIPSRIPLGYGNVSWNTNPHNWMRQLDRKQNEYLGKLVPLSYQNANQNYPNAQFGLASATMANGLPGDWNTGIGSDFDGSQMLLGDQGYVSGFADTYNNVYFPSNITSATSSRNFVTYSPNRQVYSPVIFGSIPAGVNPAGDPNPPAWRTLLFCPNPAAKNAHPGHATGGTGGPGPDARPPFNTAPDHLFLDYFWMPVVEPYAISEPFSTAGKVNINTQIVPFTHVRRDTALHAALRALRMPALPNTVSEDYKPRLSELPKYSPWDKFPTNPSWRYDIDSYAVIEGMFNRRFTKNDLYRSASELTTIYMVARRQPSATTSPAGPAGATPLDRYNNTPNWWDDKILSGDNVRENPYDALYSRITTKSNTFRVHYRAQALRQRAASRQAPATLAWDRWVEDADLVLAEYRGSALIERFVDPDDKNLPDFMNPANFNKKLGDHYRWRTIENKQFVP